MCLNCNSEGSEPLVTPCGAVICDNCKESHSGCPYCATEREWERYDSKEREQ